MRTCYTGQVCRDHLGQTVTLFGWVHRRRDHGGVIFIDMRDRAGLAQIVFDPDNVEGFAIAERLRNEFCIRLIGASVFLVTKKAAKIDIVNENGKICLMVRMRTSRKSSI